MDVPEGGHTEINEDGSATVYAPDGPTYDPRIRYSLSLISGIVHHSGAPVRNPQHPPEMSPTTEIPGHNTNVLLNSFSGPENYKPRIGRDLSVLGNPLGWNPIRRNTAETLHWTVDRNTPRFTAPKS